MKAKKTLSLILAFALIFPLFCFPASAEVQIISDGFKVGIPTVYYNESGLGNGIAASISPDGGVIISQSGCLTGYRAYAPRTGTDNMLFLPATIRWLHSEEKCTVCHEKSLTVCPTVEAYIELLKSSSLEAVEAYVSSKITDDAVSAGQLAAIKITTDEYRDYYGGGITTLKDSELFDDCSMLSDFSGAPQGSHVGDTQWLTKAIIAANIYSEQYRTSAPESYFQRIAGAFTSAAAIASLNRKAETIQIANQYKEEYLTEETEEAIIWWARYYKLYRLCAAEDEEISDEGFKKWVEGDKDIIQEEEGSPTANNDALSKAAATLDGVNEVPDWWKSNGGGIGDNELAALSGVLNNIDNITDASGRVIQVLYPIEGSEMASDTGPDYSTFSSYEQAAKDYTAAYQSSQFSLGWSSVQYLENKMKGILGYYHGALSDTVNDEFVAAISTPAFYSTEDSMWPSVGFPRSVWLKTTPSGLIAGGCPGRAIPYLIMAYQEFGYYCTNIVRNLGPILSEDSPNLIQRSSEIQAVKSLHDILIYMNDPALTAVWNMTIYDENGNALDYNMSSIYDFLMSSGAFSGITEYDYSQTESPLRHFFNMSKLSPEIMTGIKASASFIPMATNVYDPYTWSDLVNDEWLLNFHAKFGYNRKALYIDTSKDAALNYTRTKGKGATRVCTLEDLLNPDVDIVLYLDDNFYNINQLSEIVDKAYTRLNNNDEANTKLNLFQSIGEAISGLWDESMENLAKTARASTYSTKIDPGSGKWKRFFLMVQSEGETDGTEPATTTTGSGEEVYTYAYEYLKPDDLLGEDGALKDGYEQSTYTPMTGFAVLSSIYMGSRDDKYNKNLLQTLNRTINQNTPVFISSPTVPAINESLNYSYHQRIIFNYLILKNIDSNMSVDYAVNMDMDSPVYMDIYGNIVTESGYVVVPAAANSTLWTKEYIPYSAAFYATYGNDFTLPYDEENEALNDYLETWMAVDDGMWVLKGFVTQNGNIDLTRLSTADKDTMAEITETLYTYLAGQKQYYTLSQWQMLITEVLRGAPIEYIDKSFEQLDNSVNTSRGGLIVADKLETLTHALKGKDGTNSNITVPNIAYIDGLEYLIFFVYKILILAIVVIWMVNIYLDAVAGRVGLRTGGKCILAVVLVLSLIVGVPMAFDISYYQSNKLLLQDETQYLMMLNLEKEQSGQEIGITSIRPPETTTKLYLKLADIKIPWWELFGKIAMSSTYRNMEELYSEYEGQHPIAAANDVTVRNESVYVAVDDLFNSSTISFSPTTKNLFQYSRRATPCSYYTPYYVFLDNIIASSNAWCAANEYYSYTSKIMAGGKLKTFGFIKNYFASEEFLSENYDFFNLYQIYGVDPPRDYQFNIDYESVQNLISGTTNEGTVLDNIRNSQWCNYGAGSQESTAKRIQKVNNFAKTWVAENYNMIGKVSDETFLKCFALACACEHNRVFNTMRADYLEIDQLSQEDLMRMSIADKDAVMRYSTMSYARFVYTVGGTTAVYAAALASLINFVASWVKPACTILVFLICCASIFILKLILRRGNNSIWGYCTTIGLMCSINVLGAVITKLSMYLPSLGFSPTVCLIIQILIQVVYLSLLVRIVKTALKDWTNVGYSRYDATLSNRINRRYRSTDYGMPRQANAWGYYNNLVERDRRRRTGAIYGR